jgi:L-iditol 2-dehydrogenase
MRALALTAVRQFQILNIPKPAVLPASVLIRIAAVGLCGTDFHIYSGEANYHLDSSRSPIPLTQSAQVLGHEIAGWVEEAGSEAQRWQPGDLVVIDQVLSCKSRHRDLCEYCEAGDTHQCEFGQELGITGVVGGFSEFMVVPEMNIAKVPLGLSPAQAAVVEPLGCIIHAQNRVDAANTIYTWEGKRRIKHVAILGAGPAGLLFQQYLRGVKRFSGEIFVFDQREAKLNLAKRLGSVAVDVRNSDPAEIVRRGTCGEGVQYLIEASGNGRALDLIGQMVRRQATLLLYGAGHATLSPGCLTPWQSMELSLVCSAGASGRLSQSSGPEIYALAAKLIYERKIDVACLITHKYPALDQVPQAFATDWLRDDFIKALYLAEVQPHLQPNNH